MRREFEEKSTNLKYNQQKLFINGTIQGGKIMSQHGIVLRSQIWAPIDSTTCSKMKINGHRDTINLDGHAKPINRTPGQQGQHATEIKVQVTGQ